jgi:hypothetical protein
MRPEGYLTARRFWIMLAASVVVWAAGGAACLFWGQIAIPPADVVGILFGRAASEESVSIVLMQRVPRVLLALLAGGGLAVAGAVFQALLRNPLATPHTLGVSAGGALGAGHRGYHLRARAPAHDVLATEASSGRRHAGDDLRGADDVRPVRGRPAEAGRRR